jgi:small subunit ribosomal protein S3
MGHKVHPVGFRLGVIKTWEAKWYADRHFVSYLQEDLRIRKAIRSMYPEAGVSLVEIDRQANNVSLTIHTARPGILIGRGGQRVDEMRANLEKLIGKRVQLNIREVQQPEFDAYLVARSVAESMERRVAYRRALKQALQRSIQAGAKGMRIRAAGRLDGAEIARRVTMHEGRVPLHTLRADIDYGFTEAKTVMGRIGIKVWIYKGEILPEKEEAETTEAAAQPAVAPSAEAKQVAFEEQKPSPIIEQLLQAAEAKAEKKSELAAEAAPVAEEKVAKPAVKRVRKPAAEKGPTVAAETAPAEEAQAVKPAAKRVRKPAKEKTEEVAPEAVSEEKPVVKRVSRATTTKSGTRKTKDAASTEVAETGTPKPSVEKQGDSDVTT